VKISRLTLKNWRNHKDSTLDLNGVNLAIVVGLSRAGKSSIPAAIEQALTGRCEWTGERGEGAEGLITQGEAAAILSLESDGPPIQRKVPNALQVGTERGGLEAQQASIYEGLGCNRETVREVLHVQRFLGLPESEQKDILFQRLGVRMNGTAILDALATWDPELPNLAAFFRSHMQDLGKQGAHDYCFAARRDRKKDLQAARSLLDAIPGGAANDGGKRIADLVQALGAIGIDLETKREEVAEHKSAKKKARDLDEKVAREEEDLKQLRDAHKPAARSASRKDVAKAADAQAIDEARKVELEALIESGEKVLTSYDVERTGLQRTIQALRGASGKCPLSDSLKCPHDMTGIAADLDKQAKGFEDASDAAKVQEHREELTAVRERLAKAAEVDRKIAARESEEKVAADRIAAKTESLKQLKAERAAIALPTPEQEDALRIAIEDLKVRQTGVQEERARLVAARDGAEKRQGAEQAVHRLTVEVAQWESLVKAFAPGGIKARILAEKVGPFAARVSALLGALLPGSAVEFVVEPYGVWVTLPGRGRLPAHVLSTSEQALVGLVIQWAFAECNPLGLLVLDNLEHLDPPLRNRLYSVFVKQGKGLQVLALMVLSAQRDGKVQVPDPPKTPGVALFVVEDGSVRRVTAEAEGLA